MKAHARSQRGFSLFDGVIALSLLGFGLLALVRFETRTAGTANEATQRAAASLLADELLNAMLVDSANANCYTLPAAGGCGNAPARTATDAWQARALAKLPHATDAKSEIDVPNNRMTVTLTWYHKDSGETRKHEVSSDIR